ncbi:long-chain fatty acid--CoA ligase [bacterium]|nr:long-chain fatty acid--CoA ligase [bacterium]
MYRYESYLRPNRGLYPLSELAFNAARDFGDKPVMRTWNGNGYSEISFNEFGRRVGAVARWLLEKGLQHGDRVAILSENRPDWGAVYLGTQAAGGVIVPVDSLMHESGIRHIIHDSESRFLFASGKFVNLLAEVEPISTLEATVSLDTPEGDGVLAYTDVLDMGSSSSIELPKRELDELAAIIYTSGTTGTSKGVMLSQENIMSNVAAASRILPLDTKDTFLSVLPMHHTYECTTGFLLPIYCGSSITYARSMKSTELLEDMKRTNVTIMVAVPLLYEKMYAGITRNLKKQGAVTRGLISTLMGITTAGEKMNMRLGKALFRSLREKAGLGSVVFFVSGGGPLDPRVAEFFNRLGIYMLQGYGLTETSPLTHVNLPKRIRNICVGPPIIDVEHKIDDPDANGIGEILLRGPNIFLGYYKNEEATREAKSEDGWFRSGDLGKVYPDDYLQITGRKKNMLVTAGGKNVFPEEVEHYLNRSPYIMESVVLGVPRESGYGDEVAALVYPDYEQIDVMYEEKESKASESDVLALLKAEVKEAQKTLPEYKRVHRIRIMEEEFQKTSTRKIKRYLYSGDMLKINGEKV